MVTRLLFKTLKQSPKSLLLLGPRQVGKSTLLNSLNPDLVINLASESEYFRYSSDPGLLESIIEEQKPKLVLIDEIQRIPSLLNSVQYILDSRKRTIKFLISGSSARKLRRGHANLLPGRIFTYSLSGISAQELKYETTYLRALSFGFLPEPVFEKNTEQVQELLRNYSSTYLVEEIQAEALTRNIQGFSRFLHIIAAGAGQIMDYSKISTKSKVARTSTIRFIEILEDTLIAERLHSFSKAEDADTIKHPKIYFFDVGVLNGLLDNFKASSDRIGTLFEHLVYNQIRNSALALNQKAKFHFFRTRSGLEVDFIIELKGKVWAIEAKSGQVDSSDLNGLKGFKEYYPKVHRCVAVGLKESSKRSVQGMLVCGLNELLKEMGL